jgi:hypothetical protein
MAVARSNVLSAEELAGELVTGHDLLDGEAALNCGRNAVVVFDV